MVCFIWLLFLVFSTTFVCAESDDKLVSLNCQSENHGVFGQNTLLKCSATCKTQEMEIVSLVWRRAGQRKPLVIHSKGREESRTEDRFQLTQKQWTGTDIDVSFLIKHTKRTDEGQYECILVTDSGEDKAVISLKVTANYAKPEMNSIPEKDIKDDDKVTIFCNASGGFPKGMIHWFDQIGTNWTRSAELTEVETQDKLISLFSKFTLRASSSFTVYKCSVLNNKGEEEDSAEFILQFKQQQLGTGTPEDDKNTKAIVAVSVVIGALVVGLLVLVLVRQWRSRREYTGHFHLEFAQIGLSDCFTEKLHLLW
ncbi:hypothetical protein JZ751_026825 [Albula glossodonta]|uniref:Ig-like domain-containing protein n=1 Tax=Albula glossodonta TaxID=121402 RepID=A0A8T2PL28_9TELE|nr:hypothetical protein JZ751_026825 [Albula glossodonta]